MKVIQQFLLLLGLRALIPLSYVSCTTDHMLNTPLHYASKLGNLYQAQLLIRSGADINAQGMTKMTPLHYAAKAGHPKLVKLLLENGAEPDSHDGNCAKVCKLT